MSPRLSRLLLNGAIVGGLTLAAWPLGQNLYARWNQAQLDRQWQQQNARVAANAPLEKVAVALPKSPVKTPKKQDWPLTKLSIPAIDLETYALQGWDDATLRRGPGHGPNTGMPGQGNCVLAGHRNIYGSYFYKVDQLLPGTPIILESRKGKWVYTTARVYTTTDTDSTIYNAPAPGQAPILTLITCTMPHTSNRIIVEATLSESNS